MRRTSQPYPSNPARRILLFGFIVLSSFNTEGANLFFSCNESWRCHLHLYPKRRSRSPNSSNRRTLSVRQFRWRWIPTRIGHAVAILRFSHIVLNATLLLPKISFALDKTKIPFWYPKIGSSHFIKLTSVAEYRWLLDRCSWQPVHQLHNYCVRQNKLSEVISFPLGTWRWCDLHQRTLSFSCEKNLCPKFLKLTARQSGRWRRSFWRSSQSATHWAQSPSSPSTLSSLKSNIPKHLLE